MTTIDSQAELPRIGHLQAGPRDAITDVAGVSVGHATRAEGACQTGVTVLRPMPAIPIWTRFRRRPV